MIFELDLLRRPTNYAWKFGRGILNISCKKVWRYGQKTCKRYWKQYLLKNGVFWAVTTYKCNWKQYLWKKMFFRAVKKFKNWLVRLSAVYSAKFTVNKIFTLIHFSRISKKFCNNWHSKKVCEIELVAKQVLQFLLTLGSNIQTKLSDAHVLWLIFSCNSRNRQLLVTCSFHWHDEYCLPFLFCKIYIVFYSPRIGGSGLELYFFYKCIVYIIVVYF